MPRGKGSSWTLDRSRDLKGVGRDTAGCRDLWVVAKFRSRVRNAPIWKKLHTTVT